MTDQQRLREAARLIELVRDSGELNPSSKLYVDLGLWLRGIPTVRASRNVIRLVPKETDR